MPRSLSLRAAALLACLLTAAFALGACGGGAKTVTVSSSPPATSSAPSASTSATTATTAPPARTTAPGTTTTRTAPEPAFTEERPPQARSEGLSAAAALVRAKGYTPNDTADYHPEQTLRVLTGTRTGSSDGYGQQAFFFLDGRYLGTDAKEPSAQLKVLSQSDTEVAIAYPLYRHGDPLSSPSGGTRVVHFALNDGKLTALDPIPPASSSTGLARN